MLLKQNQKLTKSLLQASLRHLSRSQHLESMKEIHFDMLIIGAGANGAGVALDAASRGYKCAVIDQYDFASGTSSRSTKMAHGGIRYFEQMMLF